MTRSLRNSLVLTLVSLVCLAATAQLRRNGPEPLKRPDYVKAEQAARSRGLTIYEGDLIRDKPVSIPERLSLRPRPESIAIAYSQYLWPKVNGVATVYYVIDPASDPNATPKINTAIDTFNADFPGLIQWVQWTSSDGPNYVDINLSASDTSGVCEAVEGYEAEPAQPVDGSTDCDVPTILHEMGHVIGLWHEMTRADRNTYVSINYNNVIKGSWPDNFPVETDNEQILGLYDYASLMEYEPYSFSRNGAPVIESIPAGIPMTGVEGVPVAATDYSAGDKETIQRLYGSAPTQITVTSNPVGLQVIVDGQAVTTPQTYSWALNSTHTLNVPSGAQSLNGDIAGSTTSASFYYTYGRWNDSTAQSHTITITGGNGGPGFPASAPQFATYSANFIQLVPYTSAVYPAGSGTVAISPTPQTFSGTAGEFLVARQTATLTATPSSGWSLYELNNSPYWLPGGLSANPKEFYVPDSGNPINPTAYFSDEAIYTVDVTPESFSSNLGAIVDGGFWWTPKNFSPFYDSTWTPSSAHTLNIDSPQYPYSSNSRYAFSSWSDSGAQSHSIASLPTTSTSYIATVTPQFQPATNFSYPPCGGSGAISPTSPTNDGFYPTGQQLSFSATPSTGGWSFGGWSFDLTGSTNPASLTASDETLVYANFNTTTAPLALAGLSPASAVAGGPAFTLTITGTGFTADSLVFINDTFRTSTFVNAQTLQVAMTTSDIASAKAFQVFVENYPSGWTGCAVYGAMEFVVTASQQAAMLTPTPGSIIPGSATFTWTAGSGATAYFLSLGNKGAGSANLWESGSITATTVTANNLPLSGGTMNATLFTMINGVWKPAYYTYTLAQPAALTAPTPGSVIPGAATFTWTAGTGVTAYFLSLGTNGQGSANLWESGSTTATTVMAKNLPVNGATINATLFSMINGTWRPTYYTFTEAQPAALTAPTPGSIIPGSATFTWTAGTGVTAYFLSLGTNGPGSANLYESGSTTATTAMAKNLPLNGATINATLFSMINGVWKPVYYTFTEAQLAALSTPTPGSVLDGSSVTFTWTAGTGVTAYFLSLGTNGPGSANLWESGSMTATTVTANGLPMTGGTMNATLFSMVNGVWKPVYYTYTEASPEAIKRLPPTRR